MLDSLLSASMELLLDTQCFRRGRNMVVSKSVQRTVGHRDTARCWRTWGAQAEGGRYKHRLIVRAARHILIAQERRAYGTWVHAWEQRQASLTLFRRVLSRLLNGKLAASLSKWRSYDENRAHAMRVMRRGAALLVSHGTAAGFRQWLHYHEVTRIRLAMLKHAVAAGGVPHKFLGRWRRNVAKERARRRGLAALTHSGQLRAWKAWQCLLQTQGRKLQAAALVDKGLPACPEGSAPSGSVAHRKAQAAPPVGARLRPPSL